jgi:cupin 2 domain-containing protein
MKATNKINANILQDLPLDLKDEIFETIFKNSSIKIERIISYGQSSPIDFWYEQEKNEFIILQSGEARLEFEDKSEIILHKGDYTMLPKNIKHRVAFTAKDEVTVWLAIFFN